MNNNVSKESNLVLGMMILILLCLVFFLINYETSNYLNYTDTETNAPVLYIKIYKTTNLILSTLLPIMLAMFYTIRGSARVRTGIPVREI